MDHATFSALLLATHFATSFVPAVRSLDSGDHPDRSPHRPFPHEREKKRDKGTLLNSASLAPKPVASSVYVRVPEAAALTHGRYQSRTFFPPKRFVNTITLMPCQIVRGGRRLIYRLLSWNEWQGVFLRVVHALRC
jgi:hypothetical protein